VSSYGSFFKKNYSHPSRCEVICIMTLNICLLAVDTCGSIYLSPLSIFKLYY
jgi:hypothetical protein